MMGFTTLRTAITAALLLPAASIVLMAQSPRIILFEELSNASCGPCAAQNPTFHAFFTQQNPNRVLGISFRSRYPGRDVMHDANVAVHDGRVTYYGSPGVPHVRMSGRTAPPSAGWYDGGAADTVAQSKFLAALPATSPITLNVTEERTGTTGNVTVSVNSTDALANATVKIVVVEAHHNYASAGTNGEKDFYNVAREMLPSVGGTAITLTAGETKTITQSYTIDAANWNVDQLFVIAFVQNDNTKEILQAAASQQRPVLNLEVASAPVAIQPDEVGAKTWDGAVKTNVSGKYKVTIDKKLPGGWSGSVTIGGTTVANGDSISLTAGADAALAAEIVPTGTRAGAGRVTVELTNGHQEVQKTFRLFSGKADIAVLVRDEGRAEIADRYDEALGKTDRNYFILDAGVENMFTLSSFKVVAMETGKNVLGESDVALLKTIINGGGRLFLAGAEIAWGLQDTAAKSAGYYADPEFVRNMLRANYLADGNSALTTVKGTNGDPITNGLNTRINTGVNNQDTPDEFSPGTGAIGICTYNDGKGAGLRFANGAYRLVYFGFGMEGIGDATVRADLMEKSIAWLLGNEVTSSVATTGNFAGMAIGAQPNPASGMIEIPVTLPQASVASVTLHNARGEQVAVIADHRRFDAGTATLRFDATLLPSGQYVITLATPAGRATRMVTVVH